MNTQKNYSLGPFVILTFIYFIVGFLTTVNGQFQSPLKVAFLSGADSLRNTLTTLISFFSSSVICSTVHWEESGSIQSDTRKRCCGHYQSWSQDC